MDGQVVGAMMSCRVHEDGKGGNANEVCFGDGVPNAAEQAMHTKCLSAMGCPKAAEQAMYTKCLSTMGCPKAAKQAIQTPFYDHFDHRDHLV